MDTASWGNSACLSQFRWGVQLDKISRVSGVQLVVKLDWYNMFLGFVWLCWTRWSSRSIESSSSGSIMDHGIKASSTLYVLWFSNQDVQVNENVCCIFVPSTQPPLSVPSTQPPLTLFSHPPEIQIIDDNPPLTSSAQQQIIILDEEEEPVSHNLSLCLYSLNLPLYCFCMSVCRFFLIYTTWRTHTNSKLVYTVSVMLMSC